MPLYLSRQMLRSDNSLLLKCWHNILKTNGIIIIIIIIIIINVKIVTRHNMLLNILVIQFQPI
jgi:hypothetical protein